MIEYPKIQTVFKRDLTNIHMPILEGQWTLPEFEYLANNRWIFTEKVEGVNIRVMFQNGNVSFKGKAEKTQIPKFLLDRLKERFLPLVDRVNEVFNTFVDVCFYGEGYGNKIQKYGSNYRNDQDFILFDIMAGNRWLDRKELEYTAFALGIDIVPIIGVGTLYDAIGAVKHGIKSTWGHFEAEGIVATPQVEFLSCNGNRVITKIKTRDFKQLLKNKVD